MVTVKKLFVISKALNKKIHPSNTFLRKAHCVVRPPPPPPTQLNLFVIRRAGSSFGLGGGGKDLRGLTIFFSSVGAHQWRSQVFCMGGGGGGGARVPNVATKN